MGESVPSLCVTSTHLPFLRVFQLTVWSEVVQRPSGDIILTGLGVHIDHGCPCLFAPLNSAARWDQPGWEQPDFENRIPESAEAFNQAALWTKNDVIFHESCWSLLGQYINLNQSAMERLYWICRSFPYPLRGTTLSWGHDYGGIVSIDDEGHYPWEDRYVDREIDFTDPLYTADPIVAPEAQDILSERPQTPPCSQVQSLVASSSKDILSVLPLELLCEIAAYLSTAGFLQARLASRAFGPIFHRQDFWASRFHRAAERSWFFEVKQYSTRQINPIDWRSLYHRTNPRKLGPNLQNRLRIWDLFQLLPGCLSLRWLESPSPTVTSSGSSPSRTAAAQLREPEPDSLRTFDQGCCPLRAVKLTVPHNISVFTTYLVQLADATYICGLRVVDSGGDMSEVGYHSPYQQSAVLPEASTIQGIVLGVGARGVQAIKLRYATMDTDETLTQWLGTALDCPKTHRLEACGDISGLEASFDVSSFAIIGANH